MFSFPSQSSCLKSLTYFKYLRERPLCRALREREFVYRGCGEQKISSPSDSQKGGGEGEGPSGVLIGLRRMTGSKDEEEVVVVVVKKNMWDFWMQYKIEIIFFLKRGNWK